ncbi:MAG: NAD-dependent epimerase/dehydratase [Anaerolineales bacterium]
MEKTFLVTGAMGCIGAWVLKHLVEKGERAVAFDLSEDRHRLDWLMTREEQEAAEQAPIVFVKGDLTDTAQVKEVFRAQGVTNVVHLAALQIPFCRANPVVGAEVNVTGMVNVFEAAKEAGVQHVTYASSVAVYGPATDYPPGPVAHEAPHAPRTLYGVYKVANEGTARVYWQDHGISSVCLRPFTVYGVGRDQGLTSDPTKAMWAAVRGEPFEIGFGGRMEFHLASDVALQFIDAAEMPDEARRGAYAFNLGTPPASVDEVIEIIRTVRPGAQITRKNTILPFPECFDGTALRAHVGRVYETPLAEGIRATMEHLEKIAPTKN